MPIHRISPSPGTCVVSFGLAVCLCSPVASAHLGPAPGSSPTVAEPAPSEVPDAPAPSAASQEAEADPSDSPAAGGPTVPASDPAASAPRDPVPPNGADDARPSQEQTAPSSLETGGESSLTETSSLPSNGGQAVEEPTPEPGPPAEPTVPDRLSRGQKAGWWTILAVAALGTTAGVLSGFAEREEDRALRLATRVDLATGGQLLYADVQDEYEDILERGQTFETTSIVFGSLAGAAAIAAITLFVVDAHRRHRGRATRASQPHHGAWIEVKF